MNVKIQLLLWWLTIVFLYWQAVRFRPYQGPDDDGYARSLVFLALAGLVAIGGAVWFFVRW